MEKTMSIFDELLRLRLIESLTETPNWESTWWADTVFRGLQEDFSDERDPDCEVAAEATQRPAKLM